MKKVKWLKIEDLDIYISDGNYSSKYPRATEFVGSGIPFIRANNFSNKTISPQEMYFITPEKHQTLLKGHIKTGDVLITTRGDLGKTALVPESYNDANINAQIVLLRANPQQIDPKFLIWCFDTVEVKFQITQLQTGTALQQLPVGKLRKIEVPVPPLEEQKRIAEILDQAEELRTKRRDAIAQLNTLPQSIFLEMFGDPVFNPQKLRRVELVDMCSSAKDIKCGPFGTQLSKDEYITEGIPLWGIKNVNALFKIPTHEFLEAQTAKKLIQYSIEPGDIVMTRKGTVGNCAVYPDSYPLGIMHSDLLRLRVNRQKCDPIFLSHQLHYSRDVESQLALISGGAIMPGINVTKLKSLEVLVPPLALQQEFSHRVEVVEKLKAAHCASLSELDALFASLQHRAFTGEL